MSNAETAEDLVIDDATTKTHVAQLLVRLGLRDYVWAVVYAYLPGVLLGHSTEAQRAGRGGRPDPPGARSCPAGHGWGPSVPCPSRFARTAAARCPRPGGDTALCPLSDGPKPHGGGPITPVATVPTVLIGRAGGGRQRRPRRDRLRVPRTGSRSSAPQCSSVASRRRGSVTSACTGRRSRRVQDVPQLSSEAETVAVRPYRLPGMSVPG